MLISLLITFPLTTCRGHEHADVFPGQMCSDRNKNPGCEQIIMPEGTSSAIFGFGTTVKGCELKRCAGQIRSRTENKNEFLEGKFGNLNFLPSTKKTYLLLAEFDVRTVSYGPSFFLTTPTIRSSFLLMDLTNHKDVRVKIFTTQTFSVLLLQSDINESLLSEMRKHCGGHRLVL